MLNGVSDLSTYGILQLCHSSRLSNEVDDFSCMMIFFNFGKSFITVDGICANNLFHTSAFSKVYNGKCAKGFPRALIYL